MCFVHKEATLTITYQPSSTPSLKHTRNHKTDNPQIFTSCGHHFHMQCIYEWLERGRETCPLCEAPIAFDEDAGGGAA